MREKIKIVLCVILVLALAAGAFVFVERTMIFGTSATRLENKYKTEIAFEKSEHDTDKDGIDDRTEMFNGVLEYIKTKPKYKSKYYSTGYPDDEYGVCTDVIANGMKEAGFDLMELVADDIAKHPDMYEIDTPDKRIDFRRVRNLKVYFKNNAIELTTDINEIDQWQAGDIVIFEKHIGVISDRRNKNGVPYLIHHGSAYQKSYEQNILEKRDDIVGHYRLK